MKVYPEGSLVILPADIDRCFETMHQVDVVVALNRKVYDGGEHPWEPITRLCGYPKAGRKLHEYVMEKFILFDRLYHSNVYAGGAWLNQGWSLDDSLEDWEVELAAYEMEEAK